MATSTTILSLRKPEGTDFVSVALDIAGNMDTIDAKWTSVAPSDIGSAAAAGSNLTVARSNHVHTVGSGNVSSPGLPVGEAGSGFYRIGTGNIGATISGALSWAFSATGIALETALALKHVASVTALSGYVKLFAKSDENVYKHTGAGDEVRMLDADVFATAGRLLYATGAEAFAALDAPASLGMVNGTLTASVASNALTIALKTAAGTDPSSTDPVYFYFRNVTAADGTYSVVAVTAATSVVVSSGSTLGTTSSTAFRVWVVAFNDGGTVRLGVINCRSGTTIYPLAAWEIASSTAEGGAGAADSAQVFYTGAAVTSKAYATLGYATWESGLGTAGTWSAGPTRLELVTAQTPLPGRTVQAQATQTGAAATGTTTIPADDTIPQNTEGDQYMSQAITPTSAANVLDIETKGRYAHTVLDYYTTALFQDTTANALAASNIIMPGANYATEGLIHHLMLAATTSSTTFKVRGGSNSAGTTTFNGVGGGRLFGGVLNAYLRIAEIMA